MLAPNKQNLLLLKNQKILVASGHKLLKEKRTGLIVTFLDLAKEGKILEKKVMSEFSKILTKYRQITIFIDIEKLLQILNPVSRVKLAVTKKRISGVRVENLDLEVTPNINPEIKQNLKHNLLLFIEFFPKLMKLEQTKLICQKIGEEIVKVNRQISNLDNKLEEIDSQIKFIKQALNEQSNLEKATLIKIFK